MKITVKQARIGKEMSQAEMANCLGVNLSTYKRYEKDPGSMRVSTAFLFSEITKVPTTQIIWNVDKN